MDSDAFTALLCRLTTTPVKKPYWDAILQAIVDVKQDPSLGDPWDIADVVLKSRTPNMAGNATKALDALADLCAPTVLSHCSILALAWPGHTNSESAVYFVGQLFKQTYVAENATEILTTLASAPTFIRTGGGCGLPDMFGNVIPAPAPLTNLMCNKIGTFIWNLPPTLSIDASLGIPNPLLADLPPTPATGAPTSLFRLRTWAHLGSLSDGESAPSVTLTDCAFNILMIGAVLGLDLATPIQCAGLPGVGDTRARTAAAAGFAHTLATGHNGVLRTIDAINNYANAAFCVGQAAALARWGVAGTPGMPPVGVMGKRVHTLARAAFEYGMKHNVTYIIDLLSSISILVSNQPCTLLSFIALPTDTYTPSNPATSPLNLPDIMLHDHSLLGRPAPPELPQMSNLSPVLGAAVVAGRLGEAGADVDDMDWQLLRMVANVVIAVVRCEEFDQFDVSSVNLLINCALVATQAIEQGIYLPQTSAVLVASSSIIHTGRVGLLRWIVTGLVPYAPPLLVGAWLACLPEHRSWEVLATLPGPQAIAAAYEAAAAAADTQPTAPTPALHLAASLTYDAHLSQLLTLRDPTLQHACTNVRHALSFDLAPSVRSYLGAALSACMGHSDFTEERKTGYSNILDAVALDGQLDPRLLTRGEVTACEFAYAAHIVCALNGTLPPTEVDLFWLAATAGEDGLGLVLGLGKPWQDTQTLTPSGVVDLTFFGGALFTEEVAVRLATIEAGVDIDLPNNYSVHCSVSYPDDNMTTYINSIATKLTATNPSACQAMVNLLRLLPVTVCNFLRTLPRHQVPTTVLTSLVTASAPRALSFSTATAGTSHLTLFDIGADVLTDHVRLDQLAVPADLWHVLETPAPPCTDPLNGIDQLTQVTAQTSLAVALDRVGTVVTTTPPTRLLKQMAGCIDSRCDVTKFKAGKSSARIQPLVSTVDAALNIKRAIASAETVGAGLSAQLADLHTLTTAANDPVGSAALLAGVDCTSYPALLLQRLLLQAKASRATNVQTEQQIRSLVHEVPPDQLRLFHEELPVSTSLTFGSTPTTDESLALYRRFRDAESLYTLDCHRKSPDGLITARLGIAGALFESALQSAVRGFVESRDQTSIRVHGILLTSLISTGSVRDNLLAHKAAVEVLTNASDEAIKMISPHIVTLARAAAPLPGVPSLFRIATLAARLPHQLYPCLAADEVLTYSDCMSSDKLRCTSESMQMVHAALLSDDPPTALETAVSFIAQMAHPYIPGAPASTSLHGLTVKNITELASGVSRPLRVDFTTPGHNFSVIYKSAGTVKAKDSQAAMQLVHDVSDLVFEHPAIGYDITVVGNGKDGAHTLVALEVLPSATSVYDMMCAASTAPEATNDMGDLVDRLANAAVDYHRELDRCLTPWQTVYTKSTAMPPLQCVQNVLTNIDQYPPASKVVDEIMRRAGVRPEQITHVSHKSFMTLLRKVATDRHAVTTPHRSRLSPALVGAVLPTFFDARLVANTIMASAQTLYAYHRSAGHWRDELAASSALTFALGLGDRHLDNLFVQKECRHTWTRFSITNIDVEDIFDSQMSSHVPEHVPFRLTPILRATLGSEGLPGMAQRLARLLHVSRTHIHLVHAISTADLSLCATRDHEAFPRDRLEGAYPDPLTELSPAAQALALVDIAASWRTNGAQYVGWRPFA